LLLSCWFMKNWICSHLWPRHVTFCNLDTLKYLSMFMCTQTPRIWLTIHHHPMPEYKCNIMQDWTSRAISQGSWSIRRRVRSNHMQFCSAAIVYKAARIILFAQNNGKMFICICFLNQSINQSNWILRTLTSNVHKGLF
jgi:hypothetical protein